MGAALLALIWGAWGAPLAPDPRGLARPDRPFDAEALRLHVTLHPEERALDGVAHWRLRRQSPGPLVLDQIDLDIASVRADGAEVEWWTRPGQLVVPLAGATETTVEIRWRATPETGVHFRSAARWDGFDEVYTQGQHADHRHWFPLVDHPGDRFAYEGEIVAPDGWVTATNSGDDREGYLIMFAAGRYDVHEHKQDERFRVRVPPGTSPAAVSAVLDPIPAMVRHMEARTGHAYPWGDYNQTFVQRFLYFGMENTGETINSADALLDQRLDGTRPRVEALVLHELAHQWFGDLVTCRSWQDLWLNEGFARFMEADWLLATQGEARYAEEVVRWHDRARFVRPIAGRFFHGRGHPERGQVYVGGASVLHALRMHLGEVAFWEGVQLYVERHAHGNVETRDLQRAMEDRTGRNLDWFFQQWVEMAVAAQVRAEVQEGPDRLRVKLRQVREGDRQPTLVLPIAVMAAPQEGPPVRVEGWLEDGSLDLVLPIAGAPRWVVVNPEGALPVGVELQATAERLEALAVDPSAPPHARLWAIKQLRAQDRSGALSVLLEGVASEGKAIDPVFRTAAATALGEQRASEALLPHRDDPDPEVRAAVTTALGKCVGDDVVRALEAAARSDPNPDIQAAGLRGLRRVDPVRALRLARRLSRPADRETDRRTEAALSVLGELGEPADLPRLLRPFPRGLSDNALLAGVRLALGTEEGPTRERLAGQVARAAEERLWDDDLRMRRTVVGVLREVGDAATVPLLAAARRQTALAGQQRAIDRALTAIRSRDVPAPHPAPNAQEARIRALEERLDRLEEDEAHLHDAR